MADTIEREWEPVDVRSVVVRPLYALLHGVDRLLQLVLRPRKDRVSFLSIPDYTDNAYYTYRHLVRTRTGLELVWLVGDPDVAGRITRDFAELTADRPGRDHRLRVVPRHSLRGYLLYLTSRWTFHSHGAYAFSRWGFRRHVVNLWHGMPIKAIGRLNEVSANRKQPFGTLHVATSPAYRYIIASAFGAPASKVVVSGLPRCDALHFADARASTPEQVRARLGLPEGDRLVLWMPTYRTQQDEHFVHRASRLGRRGVDHRRSFLDDLPDWALPSFSDACVAHGCTLVIKPHPLDVLNHRAVAVEHPGLRFVSSPAFVATGIQVYDLLAAADGLVSDLSSVLIDYLATRRPVGLIGFSADSYDRELLLPMDLFLESDRTHTLSRPRAVDAFCRDVRAGQEADGTDLLSRLVHDELPGPSAERVLAAVGL